ncbi:preprotein translocase subunit SecY [Paenibacillus darwinianus]|uniref:Protein translocase subunit SecY n=1 Tax=Paenibacillus darwinianus TaxID=1380763 RepID=A0A9W5S249_9BACL|nr:preprotein translocase subunit SecY [Paenibacillus darwinianus]EXX88975.1 preprotein translocase subunit SecY [Paenibacillus darwinianus]EXX89626.1 preprotein translocase subunit SecY [Paenibacillus darwinianus]EXX90288.1 preprotein translocase subunit SecY [Paenibacillus darwinianus]
MLKTLSNIWKVDDLRRRILFTLFILLVYRVGSFVPAPNIDKTRFEDINAQGADLFGLLNTFSGGALFQFSIFALGIMPYITASIIVQLLSMDVIPKFAEWAKEGENGKRKLAQITRYGTIVLGLIQAFATSIGFNNTYQMVINPSFSTYATIAIVLTAGTAFLMWLGEQITERGIGNGISIIIFAGIVASIPTHIRTIYATEFVDNPDQLFIGILKVIAIVVAIIAIIVGVIFVQQGIRKIPVQYAKRVVGRKMYGGQSTHIPLKVNGAGVIPVIFAVSLLMFPITIAQFWADKTWANWIINNMYYDQPLGMVLYVILIIAFTFFYTFVQINPVQMADQMKKNGGYIPGIRPGKPTSSYITRVMSRITLSGALFLALISVLPVAFGALAGLPRSVQLGGTSLLIVIGVALDTMKQIESQLIKRHYKGFINK